MNIDRNGQRRATKNAGITFHHPAAFWLGSLAVVVGVLFHLPMFLHAAKMHYVLVGMPMGKLMVTGMVLILVGTAAAMYGLFPRLTDFVHAPDAARVRVRALDDAPITREHITLLSVLIVALVVDVMKPATLGFIVKGSGTEYGLSKAVVALYPFSALCGTVTGSFLWGFLGDRIGRRGSILLAAVMFMSTAICGFMPVFAWNVLMCFLMGLAAGGLLPIAFALMSEIIPARHRGWLMVLLGGIGAAGGYLAASGFASLLEPHFGWRIMWFLNLPTGALLLGLNHFIPESPRFLVAQGRRDEARAIMKRFGAVAIDQPPSSELLLEQQRVHRGMAQLFRPPFVSQTAAVVLYGLGYGLVNFGFLLWLPTNLSNIGLGVGASATLIAKSALVALPGAALVSYLYARWSTKRTMVLFAALTAVALVGFALLGNRATHHEGLLEVLIVALIVSSSGIVSMLTPYASEVYPTRVRASGTGIAAAASKAGGVIGVGLVMASLAPGIGASAVITAAPVAASAALMYAAGIETRGRTLEVISAGELASVDAGEER